MLRKLLFSFAVLGFAGCAAAQLPAPLLERSQANIRSAEEVGALDVPAAKLHLQLAKDQTDAAKKMAEMRDERALLVLARADSDAELALALAHEAAAHRDALKAAEQLQTITAAGANP